MSGPEGKGRGDERGSATVIEAIILAPVFVTLCLLVIFCGRVINAKGVIDGAARDAARAASIEAGSGNLNAAASSAAAPILAGKGWSCTAGAVPVGSGRNLAARATVTCSVPLSDLTMLGVSGSKQLQSVQLAPVDFFRGS